MSATSNAAVQHELIPMLDLRPQIDALWDEFNAAFQRVMRSGQFIMGPEVAAFEREVAAYLGVEHAIGVNSGTDALVIGLRALGVGAGDEVITTPFSFFATAESICNVGATPVFVDIEEASFNIDSSMIEAAITPRTKAILPVHLYGNPAAMDDILAIADTHGLKVVEDCAQSFGARYHGRHTGTLGDVGAYSFFPTKNLGGFGDGGLIVTDDDAVAEQMRMLRAHGAKKKYHNELLGYNSRLDSLQAAFLRVKLPHIDGWNLQRHDAALRYEALLAEVDGVIGPGVSDGHIFHQYSLRVIPGGSEALQRSLHEVGISTMVYYPVPQDQLPVFRGKHPENRVSSRVAGQVLSLPIWPDISVDVQKYVIEELERALH